MTNILHANTKKQFKIIADLASVIWREHYTPIIGTAQVDYMLDKFQSEKAIEDQVADGYEYYLLDFDNESVGYISIRKEADTLFLSKIYVLTSYRGKKIGKTAMDFIVEKAKAYNLYKVRLTVNIHNTNSIAAYEKLGFKNIGPIVADIGNGYVMDDYEMVKMV